MGASLGVALPRAALSCRAAVSSGRVLKAIFAFGAALWMMYRMWLFVADDLPAAQLLGPTQQGSGPRLLDPTAPPQE